MGDKIARFGGLYETELRERRSTVVGDGNDRMLFKPVRLKQMNKEIDDPLAYLPKLVIPLATVVDANADGDVGTESIP